MLGQDREDVGLSFFQENESLSNSHLSQPTFLCPQQRQCPWVRPFLELPRLTGL